MHLSLVQLIDCVVKTTSLLKLTYVAAAQYPIAKIISKEDTGKADQGVV
jgi:hypothetical protein